MTEFYSPSTGGFYLSEVHAVIPDDKIELPDGLRQQLLEAQGQGKVIAMVGELPAAVDPPAISNDQALLNLRATRDNRLSASDWTQGADAPLSPTKVAAWKAYRQALRDLPSNTPDPLNPVWPAIPA
jgi:hypothetical protein